MTASVANTAEWGSRLRQPRVAVARREGRRSRIANGRWLLAGIIVAAAAIPVLLLTQARETAAFVLAGLALVAGVLFFVSGNLRALGPLLVVFGIAEPVLATYTRSSLVLYPDSVLLVLFVVLGVLVRGRISAKAWWALGIVAVMLLLAILRAPSLGRGVYQAREVAVPLGLTLAAYAGSDRLDQGVLSRITLAVGAVSAIYMIFEFAFGPILDPWAFEGLNGFTRLNVNGLLPGNYYFYYHAGHAPILRLGGLLLNPPATGLFMGTAAVVAARTRWPLPYRVMTAGAFLAATVATYSRAGILLAALAIALPALGRLGRLVPAAVCGIAAWLVLPVLLHQGKSAAHLNGLIGGITTGLTHPLGVGFGHVGNVAKAYHGSGVGESLVGLFAAAVGWPALVLLGFLVYWLISRLPQAPADASLAIAALAAASLSESAASLTATAALWLLVGISCARIAQMTRSAPPSSTEAVLDVH